MNTAPRLPRIAGYSILAVYIAGTWVYGGWYVWQHYEGYWTFGRLAWYGFMRAILWPLWVAFDLLGT